MSKNIVNFSGFDVGSIWDKPGNLLSDEEYFYVCEWVFKIKRDEIIGFVLDFLHMGAELDVEDALHNFFDSKNFDQIIKAYNPNKGIPFANWLKFCFRRFCYREVSKILKLRRTEILKYEPGKESENGELSPEEELLLKDDYRILDSCIDKLSPKYRDVFLLHWEGLSEKDTAEKLGISLGSVKIRRKRARAKLRLCVQQMEV